MEMREILVWQVIVLAEILQQQFRLWQGIKKGPKIRKQILFYPLTTNYEEEITDSEQHYQVGYFLNYNCMNNPMAHYFENEEDVKNSLASPLLEDNLKGLPPACFISAECDPLLDQGLQYAAKLQDAGVKVEYHIFERDASWIH